MEQAYRTHIQVSGDRTITLRDLPFQQGEEVEVIVLAEARNARHADRYPLRGTPLRYEDPMAPVADMDWEATR